MRRVLLLSDKSFAARERSMIDRLEIGLTSSGVRALRAGPPIPEEAQNDALSKRHIVQFEHGAPLGAASALGVRVTGGGRVRHEAQQFLREMIEDAGLPRERPIEVVHGWGERCWPLAIELAWESGGVAALEVWRGDLVGKLRRYERGFERRGEEAPIVWLAPTESIRNAIVTSSASRPVRLSRWGVHVPAEAHAWESLKGPAHIAVLAPGQDVAGVVACLGGIGEAVAKHEETLVFLDAASTRTSRRVWQAVREHGLESRLSLIADMEGRRELLVQADLLAIAELGIGMRSITLDAMAAGMTIISRPDWETEFLENGKTALAVDPPTPDRWGRAFRRALARAKESRRIGRAAREVIQGGFLASDQIARAVETYEWLVSADAYQFTDSEPNGS